MTERVGPRSLGGRSVVVVAAALVVEVLRASPAWAHGAGDRSDLPLPLWQLVWIGTAAVLVASAVLRLTWTRPRLRVRAEGHPLAEWAQRAARFISPVLRIGALLALAVVLSAAVAGSDIPALNPAPVAVYVVFWVGMQAISAVVGNVWSVMNPYDTLAAVGARLRGWARRARSPAPVAPRSDVGTGHPGRRTGQWTAAAGIFSFVWLELAYHDASAPRALALWLGLYTVAALAGAAWWGRSWLARGEGFAGLFALLAGLSPIGQEKAGSTDGALRLRPPLSGIARTPVVAGTGALILVTLGSTAFDGFSRTRFWLDTLGMSSGWAFTALNTVGLVWVIAVATGAYLLATGITARLGGRDRTEIAAAFVPSLIPVTLAYTVAHYFPLLVLDSQEVVALVSDPYGRGWNVFGTVERAVDYTSLSPVLTAWVQTAVLALGHVAGLIAVRDRSLELWPEAESAERAQYPMVALMVVSTAAGLLLLLGS